MKLEEIGEELTDADLNSFEIEVGLSLPKYFKEFYLKYNGGDPSHPHFKDYEISYILSINHENENLDILSEMEHLKFANKLPKNFVPFARDSGGWVFAMDLNEGADGPVYCLTNGLDEDKPRFLSPSFEEFISELSDDEDY